MTNRKKDKIQEIEKYAEELESILPTDFKIYEKDFEVKAACERYFEKIIEAVTDLGFLVIKDKGLKIPEDDKQAFDILVEAEIISEELARKLKDAKGMRNIIAHEYGRIDDELVFDALTEQLEKDIKEFLDYIKKLK